MTTMTCKHVKHNSAGQLHSDTQSLQQQNSQIRSHSTSVVNNTFCSLHGQTVCVIRSTGITNLAFHCEHHDAVFFHNVISLRFVTGLLLTERVQNNMQFMLPHQHFKPLKDTK